MACFSCYEVFMRYDIARDLIDHAPNQKKKIHILFFALISGLQNAHFRELCERICSQTGLSLRQLSTETLAYHEKWSQSLLETDLLLDDERILHLLDPVLDRNTSTYSTDNLVSLLKTEISLSLQKASMLSFKNHMKEKDIKALIQLIRSPQYPALLKNLKRLEMRIASGKNRVTDLEYIQRQMVLAELMAHFYLSWLVQDSRLSCIYEYLRTLPDWSKEQVSHYLTHALPDEPMLERVEAVF